MISYSNLMFREQKLSLLNFVIAVVNLTLIDLPGLTKVAVGEFAVFMFLLSFVIAIVSSSLSA